MDNQQAIALKNLKKDFFIKASKETINAVDDVSFEVPRGQLTALIGPDGAGKTTTIRMICGLMTPDSGSLTVLDLDAAKHPQAIQDRISYMPQKFGLYEDLTVQENLDLYADLRGVSKKERKERMDKLLKMTGLSQFTSRLAGKLSGGMKQKLGLACTLIWPPELLILDEPTAGVDPLSRRELWEILQALVKDENLTVLVSTAYMDEAALCKKVMLMNKGKLLFSGPPDELAQKAQNLCYSAKPKENVPARILQSYLLDDKDKIIDAVPQGGEVHFILRPDRSLKELDITNLADAPSPVEAKLEDGFMALLRQHAEDTGETPEEAKLPEIDVDHIKRPSHDQVVIEVKDLVRKFGDFTAVEGTTFEVYKGEIFGLLGPNGAGKTTTFRMLCGLLPATSGFLRVAGVDLRYAPALARTNVGYVAQKFSLYGNLSVKDNLEFFGGVYGLDRKQMRQRIDEVKNQFNLNGHEEETSGMLPGGFKQRLAMAVALIHKPDILFLDEPTSGIDPLARRSFWKQITSLSSAGVTMIVTTHFMEEAEYCDRIIIQDRGKMLAIGTPQEVRQKAGDATTMDEAFLKIIEQSRKEQETNQEKKS